MGYFSNGTEGCMYEETYCAKCLHYGDEDEGCPVWGAHLLHDYESGTDAASILDMLIPRAKRGCYNEQCAMFMDAKMVLALIEPHRNQIGLFDDDRPDNG